MIIYIIDIVYIYLIYILYEVYIYTIFSIYIYIYIYICEHNIVIISIYYLLGDNGNYYVPPSMVHIFKTKLIPRAYMITPNQFETELLTGIIVKTEQDVIESMLQLHKLGSLYIIYHKE